MAVIGAIKAPCMTPSIAAPSESKGERGFGAALLRAGERTHMDVRAGKRSMDGCWQNFLRAGSLGARRAGKSRPQEVAGTVMPARNGFGYFCQNKSSPLALEASGKDMDVECSEQSKGAGSRLSPG